MASVDPNEVLLSPAVARPVVLEGHWLREEGSHTLWAVGPASVVEGGAEALEELPAWFSWHAQRFPLGAAVGYLSYELARLFEKIPLARFPLLPDLSFAYYPRIEKFGRTTCSALAYAEIPPTPFRTNFDQLSYGEAVARIQAYIASGDIYQANLTQQFSISLGGQSPAEIYHRLSRGQASFRAFLKTPHRTIVSNSPERFFRVSGGRILCSPIKGTLARDEVAADERKILKLLSSEKDRAENIMIVDLVRNDLGRICRYGSISTRLCEVVSLPHLFHLVSHVEGTLRPEVSLPEIFRALFPCGSVTGAPKIRAMEVLSEIEQVPRGVSMGATGIIVGAPGSDHFEMDFNVAIRTLTIEDDVAVFNVGGGIVHDSKPGKEYEEMLLKAGPLLTALGTVDSPQQRTAPVCVLAQ